METLYNQKCNGEWWTRSVSFEQKDDGTITVEKTISSDVCPSTHVAQSMSNDQASKYYSMLRAKGWLTISEEIAKELARGIKR